MVSLYLARHQHNRYKGMKEQIYFKDLSLRRKYLRETLITKNCVKKCLSRIGFYMFSHLSIQRPQSPWCKEAWLLLELSADSGTIHMMWICKDTERKSYRPTEVSTLISKEGLGGWVSMVGSESPG